VIKATAPERASEAGFEAASRSAFDAAFDAAAAWRPTRSLFWVAGAAMAAAGAFGALRTARATASRRRPRLTVWNLGLFTTEGALSARAGSLRALFRLGPDP